MVARAYATRSVGRVRMLQGRWGDAAEQYLDAVSLFRSLGDETALAEALHDLGLAALARGRLDEARCCFDRGLPARRGGADGTYDPVVEGKSLALLGLTQFLAGERDDAYRRWHEAEKILADASSPDAPDAEEVRLWVAQWIACANAPG